MGLGLDSTVSSGDGFEDLGVDRIMTHSTDRSEDDLNPGQQDDYFDEDLAIAGHAPKSSPVPADLQNQG